MKDVIIFFQDRYAYKQNTIRLSRVFSLKFGENSKYIQLTILHKERLCLNQKKGAFFSRECVASKITNMIDINT